MMALYVRQRKKISIMLLGETVPLMCMIGSRFVVILSTTKFAAEK